MYILNKLYHNFYNSYGYCYKRFEKVYYKGDSKL